MAGGQDTPPGCRFRFVPSSFRCPLQQHSARCKLRARISSASSQPGPAPAGLPDADVGPRAGTAWAPSAPAALRPEGCFPPIHPRPWARFSWGDPTDFSALRSHTFSFGACLGGGPFDLVPPRVLPLGPLALFIVPFRLYSCSKVMLQNSS